MFWSTGEAPRYDPSAMGLQRAASGARPKTTSCSRAARSAGGRQRASRKSALRPTGSQRLSVCRTALFPARAASAAGCRRRTVLAAPRRTCAPDLPAIHGRAQRVDQPTTDSGGGVALQIHGTSRDSLDRPRPVLTREVVESALLGTTLRTPFRTARHRCHVRSHSDVEPPGSRCERPVRSRRNRLRGLSLGLRNNLKASLAEVMIQRQGPTNLQLSHQDKAAAVSKGESLVSIAEE